MKSNIILITTLLCLVAVSSCKDDLDVLNENEPTTATLTTEKGFVKFASAGIYLNGFVDLKYQDGVFGLFWGNGVFDLMADNLGAEAANVFMNQIGAPEKVTLDDNSVVPNPNAPSHQPDMLRQNNLNGNQSQNPLYYEWAYMYSLNRSANFILKTIETVKFEGDVDTKKNLLQAWAYWWKGYAYSRIGSIYHAGLVVDEHEGKTNNNYKTRQEIIAAAEENFSSAESILSSMTDNGTYLSLLGKLIPDFMRVGKGGLITPQMWIRNINTYRARNILVNKRVDEMNATDWDAVLTLTNAGILESDFVFTLRSNETGDIISSQGTLSARSTGDPASAATFKISERLIQEFQPGDDRLANNFTQLASPWIGNSDRGNVFNTRWELLDGGDGLSGVIVYSDQDAGENELYIAGTYEENELMKAEALIYKNSIDAGTASIDAVRDYQGAGLASLGTGLTQDEAIEQLRSERRVALLFRSVAFYDARRYGVIDPVSTGGGKTNAVVIDNDGNVHTNAVIDYQFMDYWDVPDNELVYNPPAEGSAAVINPKY
jgi:starch-binding outer membrane protein, SusD/RagB family